MNLAVPTVGAFEVVLRSHAVFDTVFGFECRGAGFALVFWSPMVESIHVLIRSMLGRKGPVASFAFRPMVVIVHVSYAVILSVGFGDAGLALPHGCSCR